MKRTHLLVFSFVAILAAAFLSGCPQTPVDNEVIDATVQQPVQPGEPTGGFSLRMKLYDADGTKSAEVASLLPPEESVEKGGGYNYDSGWTAADWAPIVDRQIKGIQSVEIYLYAKPLPGIDVMPAYRFSFRSYYGNIIGDVDGIRAGDYFVSASFYGSNGDGSSGVYFWASTDITIEAGVRKNLKLDAYLSNRFQFRFGLVGLQLPDDLPNMKVYAEDANGINFDCNGRIEDTEAGFKVITVSLPYDIPQPVYLKVFDRYSQLITSIPVSFSPLEGTGGIIVIDLTSGYGSVDFIVDFHPPIESNVFVKARTMNAGQDWTNYFSLQEAVNSVAGPIEVLLGVGEYEGAVIPPYTSVAITGQGADRTKIYDYDQSRGYVLWSSPWAPVPHSDVETTTDPAVPMELAKGGGAASITLYNLAVVNGPGKPSSRYSDAAVFVEMGKLSMVNCAVQSSNRFLSTSYDSGVSISHSILLSDGGIGMWASYASGNIGISNSIIMNCSTILDGQFATVDLFDSITWNCGSDITDIHKVILMKENVLSVDPLLDPNNWHVDVSGPAWANNIGIDWRG